MTTKFILLALGGALLLAPPGGFAQTNFATTLAPPAVPAPPQTGKPIAAACAKTSWESGPTDPARIEAALAANRQARTARDEARLEAARTKINLIWAGLEADRMRRQTEQAWAEASGAKLISGIGQLTK